MARPLRIEFPGAVYHITSRGNAKQAIFKDDADRKQFLGILSMVTDRFHWLCHAYCLMENHYHLLIETPRGNLSRGMRELNGVYTQRFNHRHKQVGHLFQGRYKAIIVDKDSYLLSLCAYVVLNPVRAGLVGKPERWRWSSYGATVGGVSKPAFLTTDWILSQFGEKKSMAMEKYRSYVKEGTGKESPWEGLRGQIILGMEKFVERLRGLLGEKENLKEVPRIQRYVARPPLMELIAAKRRQKRRSEEEIIYAVYARYGYTMKEIGEHLGLHYSTISRKIRRVEQDTESST